VIPKHGRLRHGLILAASVMPSAADLVRGLWGTRGRWLIPLVVFLGLTALLLLLATSVEALAPFIYSIF
jgi:hypothetical protein